MIYVNGDSFTAGTGLSDHEFVPDFEKYNIDNISVYDYYKLREKALDNSEELYKLYKTRNKELSWSARLSKILGTKVINAGEGGSSMSSIGYRTMLDLTKLQMEGITPERVIIMLTDENRVTLIQTNRTVNSNPYDLRDISRGWLESIVLGSYESNSVLDPFIKETLLLQSTNDLIIKWLVEVALVKNIVKSLTGKYPIITAPEFVVRYAVTELKKVNLHTNQLFSELFSASDILNIDYTLLMYPVNPPLPDRHYNNETHAVFAEKIATYIQTLNNKENNI
jgi:hypothetical protein